MNHSLMNTYAPLPINLCKGEGVYLYDTDGNKYLDLTSGIGVNSLGYNNPKWAKALESQITSLQHCSNIFLNPTTIELSNKLTSLCNMSKVFFSNSGAEANEGAIKLARKYSFEKYGEGRNKILTLKKSFHGRTMATLKATGQDKFHNYFFPFPEGFEYVEANNIAHLEDVMTKDVCAIMLEAIQGEGGVNPLSNDFVQAVMKLSKEKDILVIFDEVQCGIGRCGSLFGFDMFYVQPDIITLAKGLGGGLPIGAVLCNEKLSQVYKPGDHGSTFGGNPVSCAGALAVLEELANEESYEKIKAKGELVKELIIKYNSPKVKDLRGRGLMLGIEIEGNSGDIQKEAAKKGILVLTAGPNVIRLLPPLTISSEELEKGVEILLSLI